MQEQYMIQPARKRVKFKIVQFIMWFLGKGFQAAAELDSTIGQVIEKWPGNMHFLMKVEPFGPCLLMAKKNGKLLYIGLKEDEADFAVYFKNIEAALLVLTGQMGIDQAYAEHRFTMKGDIISYGMPLVRSLYLVEAYLFPSIITSRILKRKPLKQRTSFRIYVKTLLGI